MGYGSWGGNPGRTGGIISGSRYGGRHKKENNNKPSLLKKILLSVLGIFLGYCVTYNIYKYNNRHIEICGVIEDMYLHPTTHKSGKTTYTNYISLKGHEIEVSNQFYHKHNRNENVCIVYTTNSIDTYQLIGIITMIVILSIFISYIIIFIIEH